MPVPDTCHAAVSWTEAGPSSMRSVGDNRPVNSQINNVDEPDAMHTATDAEMPPPLLKSAAADWLDVNGGLVLLVGGSALIALACVFSNKATVAPVFGTFGGVLFILGSFYSRIEGRVEAGKDGVVIAVRKAQQFAREEDLSAEQTADAVERAAERVQVTSRRRQDMAQAGEIAAREDVESVRAEAAVVERQLLERFAQWLEAEEGFTVTRLYVRTAALQYDLLADKPDEIMAAEAELGGWPRGLIQIAHAPAPADPHGRRLRRALVLPAGATGGATFFYVSGRNEVEIYEVAEDGRVTRIGTARQHGG